MTLVGNSHLKLKPQPGYPRWDRGEDGAEEYQFFYHVANSQVYSFVPPEGKEIPSPITGNSPLKVKSISIVEDGSGAPGVASMLVTYGPRGTSSFSKLRAGEESFESEHRMTERPLEEHPKWDTWTDAQKQELTKERKLKVFRIGQVEHRYTKAYERGGFAYTEANLIADVNELTDPTGIVSPTADKWMKIGRRIIYRENTIEVEDTWAYDEGGWNNSVDYGRDPFAP